MTKLTGTFHNTETNEVEIRELTPDEVAVIESANAEQLRIEAEEAAKATEKTALLARLSITADEAKLLLN
jgi:hypothetical protein